MLFSERLEFERDFRDWAGRHNVAETPSNVISFILMRDDWRKKIAEHDLHGDVENVMGCRIGIQEKIFCERCLREVPMLLDGRCQDCLKVT